MIRGPKSPKEHSPGFTRVYPGLIPPPNLALKLKGPGDTGFQGKPGAKLSCPFEELM